MLFVPTHSNALGVELIKLNAWEEAFAHRVEAVRGAELKKLGLAALVKSAASVISRATPVYVTLTTFSLAVALNGVIYGAWKPPGVSEAFTTLALFNVARFPLAIFPMVRSDCCTQCAPAFASYLRGLQFDQPPRTLTLTSRYSIRCETNRSASHSHAPFHSHPICPSPAPPVSEFFRAKAIRFVSEARVGLDRVGAFLAAPKATTEVVPTPAAEGGPNSVELLAYCGEWGGVAEEVAGEASVGGAEEAPVESEDGAADGRPEAEVSKVSGAPTSSAEAAEESVQEATAHSNGRLFDVTIHVPRGSLTFIVGSVGSGKSSVVLGALSV